MRVQDESRRVLDSVRRIVRALRLASRTAERVKGMTGAQIFVLSRLAQSGALSVNDLAAATLTHQSSVSVVVQKLEGRGLIQRQLSEEDGRRSVISLTPAGRRILKSAPDLAQERIISGLAAMLPKKRKQLATLLDELVQSSGFSDEPASMFFEDETRK